MSKRAFKISFILLAVFILVFGFAAIFTVSFAKWSPITSTRSSVTIGNYYVALGDLEEEQTVRTIHVKKPASGDTVTDYICVSSDEEVASRPVRLTFRVTSSDQTPITYSLTPYATQNSGTPTTAGTKKTIKSGVTASAFNGTYENFVFGEGENKYLALQFEAAGVSEETDFTVTVTASKLYTVTYHLDGGSFLNDDAAVEYLAAGERATRPSDPIKPTYNSGYWADWLNAWVSTRTSYFFTNWYADEGKTEEYHFSSAIAGDTDIYAGYESLDGFDHNNAYVGGTYHSKFDLAELHDYAGEGGYAKEYITQDIWVGTGSYLYFNMNGAVVPLTVAEESAGIFTLSNSNTVANVAQEGTYLFAIRMNTAGTAGVLSARSWKECAVVIDGTETNLTANSTYVDPNGVYGYEYTDGFIAIQAGQVISFKRGGESVPFYIESTGDNFVSYTGEKVEEATAKRSGTYLFYDFLIAKEESYGRLYCERYDVTLTAFVNGVAGPETNTEGASKEVEYQTAQTLLYQGQTVRFDLTGKNKWSLSKGYKLQNGPRAEVTFTNGDKSFTVAQTGNYTFYIKQFNNGTWEFDYIYSGITPSWTAAAGSNIALTYYNTHNDGDYSEEYCTAEPVYLGANQAISFNVNGSNGVTFKLEYGANLAENSGASYTQVTTTQSGYYRLFLKKNLNDNNYTATVFFEDWKVSVAGVATNLDFNTVNTGDYGLEFYTMVRIAAGQTVAFNINGASGVTFRLDYAQNVTQEEGGDYTSFTVRESGYYRLFIKKNNNNDNYTLTVLRSTEHVIEIPATAYDGWGNQWHVGMGDFTVSAGDCIVLNIPVQEHAPEGHWNANTEIHVGTHINLICRGAQTAGSACYFEVASGGTYNFNVYIRHNDNSGCYWELDIALQ